MAHRVKYLTLLLIITPILVYGQRDVREAYIQKYKDIAIKQMNIYHIPASIILAQACLESANGTSRLAVKGNNHFGIKCHDWNGKTIYHDDDKKGECFRRYISAEDSFKDHSEFLKNRARYRSLFDLDQTDYKAWAHGLKAAGYATDKRYASLLIGIIEDYKLYQYDKATLSKRELKEQERLRRKEERKARKGESSATFVATAGAAAGAAVAAESITEATLYSSTIEHNIYKNNGRKYIIATGEQNYKQIAKEYNLFTKELLKFNDLESNQTIATETIAQGTIIYIERKRGRGASATYLAKEGDTPYTISQKAGIRLKSLCKKNGIKATASIAAGTYLKLK